MTFRREPTSLQVDKSSLPGESTSDPLGASAAYTDSQDYNDDVQAMTAPYRDGKVVIILGTALAYDEENHRIRVGIDGPPGREAYAQTGGIISIPTDIAGRRVRLLKNSDPNAAEGGALYFDDMVP